MKKVYLYAMAVVLVGIALGTGVFFGMHHAAASYTCVAGPNELCPSDQFHADFYRWKDIQKDIAKKQNAPAIRQLQDEVDLSNGILSRLNAQIQEQAKLGWQYEPTKERYIKAPVPMPQQPQQAVPVQPSPK